MKRTSRRQPTALRNALGNAGTGALFGAAMAAFAILVGLGRVVIVLIFGGTMESLTWSDARMLTFYVGGFVLAGAIVGVLWPLIQSASAALGAGALAGAIVMNAIAIADQGWTMDRGEWIAMTLLGAVLGCAVAFGILRRRI